MVSRYTDWLCEEFAHLKNTPLKMVADCGNGVAGVVMPAVVSKLGLEGVKLLFQEVDGSFPNHHADPVVEENMDDARRVVTSGEYDFACGFDGDADRFAAMTDDGRLVASDRLLLLYAKQSLGLIKDASVISDVRSSAVVQEKLSEWGVRSCMSPAGHSFMRATMDAEGGLLGGELSGHYFFRDRYFGYDDGIYAFLRLVELVHEDGRSLKCMLDEIPEKFSSREIRLECGEDTKGEIVESVKRAFTGLEGARITTVEGVRVSMGDGWGIVRQSNTQPMVSMRFEADTEESLKKVKTAFCDVVAKYLDVDLLRREMGL